MKNILLAPFFCGFPSLFIFSIGILLFFSEVAYSQSNQQPVQSQDSPQSFENQGSSEPKESLTDDDQSDEPASGYIPSGDSTFGLRSI